MGIDFIDLVFRVEKRFEIKIARDKALELFENGNTSDPPANAWTDIRVSDFVALIETLVSEQNPESDLDIFDGVKQDIMECLGANECEVTPEAWLVRDLGME
ncbi:MAG: hypothetical protein K0U86_09990 [Planctomycetes bacterium]|nr:hypothetical protein [Planctomycetota bacterium]MCH9725221.1 hypothetical protein [Planctomycetota bacterium]MCH9779005.1 hypothetical protein [Planctomycetota bacterium]MCH9791354.1 hypothetical protein [Planctomycetota bacterium]